MIQEKSNRKDRKKERSEIGEEDGGRSRRSS
jgi:hypothetical protein